LRADATAPGRAFAWYAVVAACVVLGSCLARLGGPGVPAAAALAGVAVVAWLAVTGLVPVKFARRAARPDLHSVTGSLYLWPVATQSLAIGAAVLASDGVLPAEPGVIVAIVAWSAGVVLYLGMLLLVMSRLVHRAGAIAVWPAALAWAITSAALVVSVVLSARRAISGRLRSRLLSPGSHPDHPVGKRRYTFEALVTIAPGGSSSAPAPGPDWRGIIRAGTDGHGTCPVLFTALVAGWDPHSPGRAGAAQALATIVAFGPEPAEYLPVGGSFTLWRGHDVGHGVVTRRIFV
jgi:Voltage-dependent anion channel